MALVCTNIYSILFNTVKLRYLELGRTKLKLWDIQRFMIPKLMKVKVASLRTCILNVSKYFLLLRLRYNTMLVKFLTCTCSVIVFWNLRIKKRMKSKTKNILWTFYTQSIHFTNEILWNHFFFMSIKQMFVCTFMGM